jgi:hypothetical protein
MFGSVDPIGITTWLAASYPLRSSGQLLVATAARPTGRSVEATDATDLVTYGVRAVRGTSGHNFFLEIAGTSRAKTAPGVSRSNTQWSGGVELQLADSYWPVHRLRQAVHCSG